uniref:7TM GPCR serpentine receptor class x (Srx) domain-containing protein n=1 Tax=Panagrolaimus superbus TaxID=310955 RepID=A0A914YI07_9BILA
MGTGCISSIISFCCDAVTFCYLYLLGKKINKTSQATLPREIRFFFQACITSWFVYCNVNFISYFIQICNG